MKILPPTPTVSLLIAVAIGGVFYLAGKVLEQQQLQPVTISVSGEGRVFGVPDIAELSFGVATGRQPTAKTAMERLRKYMNAAFGAVKAQGVTEKDIRTEHFNLNPVYDWTDQGQIFRGFEATQSLRVKVRDLDQVDDVLTAATEAGANQAGGVSFTIDDPEGLRAQARQEAIAEAKAKAQLLAMQLGERLGKLKGFSEGGGFPPPVPFMARAMEAGMGGGGDLPLPAGEQEIVMSVTLIYELR